MRFSCPSCQQAMEVPDDAAGKQVACPRCSQRLQVPMPPANKTVLGSLELGEGQHVQAPPPPLPRGGNPGAPPRGEPPPPPRPPRVGGQDWDPPSRSRRRRDEYADQGGWEDADYRPRRNQDSAGLAVASMVCGIVGVVLFCIPFLAWILGLVAVIMGFVYLNSPNRSGRGMAQAGVATGFAAIALGVIIFIIALSHPVFWWGRW